MTPRPVAAAITAVALLVAPIVGMYALVALDRFRRQAFGRYARGAAAMMVAVASGLVYYVFVVALQWRNGSVEESWTNPLGATGIMLLLQGAAAAATLAALLVGARRFLSIVES